MFNWLIWFHVISSGGWLHAKLFFVVLLIIYFLSLNVIRKRLAENRCTKSGVFFRYFNEIPLWLFLNLKFYSEDRFLALNSIGVPVKSKASLNLLVRYLLYVKCRPCGLFISSAMRGGLVWYCVA